MSQKEPQRSPADSCSSAQGGPGPSLKGASLCWAGGARQRQPDVTEEPCRLSDAMFDGAGRVASCWAWPRCRLPPLGTLFFPRTCSLWLCPWSLGRSCTSPARWHPCSTVRGTPFTMPSLWSSWPRMMSACSTAPPPLTSCRLGVHAALEVRSLQSGLLHRRGLQVLLLGEPGLWGVGGTLPALPMSKVLGKEVSVSSERMQRREDC